MVTAESPRGARDKNRATTALNFSGMATTP
jgi:hypothetical protein